MRSLENRGINHHMEDSVVDKARLLLDQKEREAAELRQFIRTYERLSGTSVALPTVNVADGSEPATDSEFSTKEEIIEAARTVLTECAPSPMHISDLYDRVVDMGIRVPGQNPKGNLSAKLAPPKDLVYVRNEGWYYRPRNEAAAAASKANTDSVGPTAGVHVLNPAQHGA